MNAPTKFLTAILVAVFLGLTPIGACAGMSTASSPPEHRCCPRGAPVDSADCANPGCCAAVPTSPAPELSLNEITPVRASSTDIPSLDLPLSLDEPIVGEDFKDTLHALITLRQLRI